MKVHCAIVKSSLQANCVARNDMETSWVQKNTKMCLGNAKTSMFTSLYLQAFVHHKRVQVAFLVAQEVNSTNLTKASLKSSQWWSGIRFSLYHKYQKFYDKYDGVRKYPWCFVLVTLNFWSSQKHSGLETKRHTSSLNTFGCYMTSTSFNSLRF